MAKRSYDQYCPAARSLDVLGERWTLLVVRDLLLGPRRYTDLLEGLPGIGPNVLAERLRHLQDVGVVRRATLPPPAASAVYELTELGQALRPVVQELTRWGLNLMGAPRPGEHLRPGWLVRVIEATARPEATRGLGETYEFRVEDEIFNVRVDDGEVEVRQGHAADPTCVWTSDFPTFIAVGARMLDRDEALAEGRAELEGDPDAGRRSIDILGPHLDSLGGTGGLLGGLEARLRPEAAGDVAESYEFRVDEQRFHVRVEDGSAEVRPGPADDPACVFSTDLATFLAIGFGRVAVPDAILEGTARVTGDAEAVARASEVVAMEAGAAAWQP